jgi:hypothetical protein
LGIQPGKVNFFQWAGKRRLLLISKTWKSTFWLSMTSRKASGKKSPGGFSGSTIGHPYFLIFDFHNFLFRGSLSALRLMFMVFPQFFSMMLHLGSE